MRLGKVSETVMNRSILKQLSSSGAERAVPLSVYEACAGIKKETSEDIVFSDVSLYGGEEQLGIFAIAQAVNQILAKGARPCGVSISIMMPPETEETFLQALIRHISQCSSQWGIPVLCIRAEVSPAVNHTMIGATAVGAAERDKLMLNYDKPAGRDIVLTKWIGMEGTLRILRKEWESLSERFVAAFLQGIEGWQDLLIARKEVEIARECGVKVIRQVTGGGIFAALWDLAAETGSGLEVKLDHMPIRQETVELCEHFRINPYQLTSSGCMLMLAKDGGRLAGILKGSGINAAVLGRITDGRDKVIYRGEEKRFLDRPAPDELLRLYDQRRIDR